MANPDADMDKLMSRMEQLQNALDASNGWELERQLEVCRHLPVVRLFCSQLNTAVVVVSEKSQTLNSALKSRGYFRNCC